MIGWSHPQLNSTDDYLFTFVLVFLVVVVGPLAVEFVGRIIVVGKDFWRYGTKCTWILHVFLFLGVLWFKFGIFGLCNVTRVDRRFMYNVYCGTYENYFGNGAPKIGESCHWNQKSWHAHRPVRQQGVCQSFRFPS